MKSATRGTKTTKAKGKTKASSNGMPPVRKIVKRLAGSKASRYIAVLECGHKYSKGRAWPRETLRCRKCLSDGPVKRAHAVKKPTSAAAKTATATVTKKPVTPGKSKPATAAAKSTNGGGAQ